MRLSQAWRLWRYVYVLTFALQQNLQILQDIPTQVAELRCHGREQRMGGGMVHQGIAGSQDSRYAMLEFLE